VTWVFAISLVTTKLDRHGHLKACNHLIQRVPTAPSFITQAEVKQIKMWI